MNVKSVTDVVVRVLCGVMFLCTLIHVSQAKPLSQKEKDLYYTFGVRMSTELAPYGLSAAALAEIYEGLKDGHKDELRLNPVLFEAELRTHLTNLVKARVKSEAQKGDAFMAAFKKRSGVVVTPMGAAFRVIEQGSGTRPSARSLVHVHYEGRTVDGVVFDSSQGSGRGPLVEPTMFPLDKVIPCWSDVIPRLTVGSKAQVVCPAQLAYGDRGAPPAIPPGATLVFDIDLVGSGSR